MRRIESWHLAAAGILSLGIGASLTIAGAIESVLLAPTALRDPQHLAVLWERSSTDVEVSWARYEQLRAESGSLEGLATVSSVNLDYALVGTGDPIQVEGVSVSANFFDVLGVSAVLGRTFRSADASPATQIFPIVISHRLWRDRFGSSPDVLRSVVRVSGAQCEIIGVMPQSLAFPRGVDIWSLQSGLAVPQFRDIRVLRLLARKKPALNWNEVNSDLNTIIERADSQLPVNRRGFRAHIEPMEKAVFGNARAVLWTLLGGAVLLLLTACANVANLFVARLSARGRELAVRVALGATRKDLVLLLLREALGIAALGAAAGLLLAHWGASLLARFGPDDVPGLADTSIRWPEAAAAVLLALLTAGLFGLAPALTATPTDPWGGLRTHPRAYRLRDLLVMFEVAVSVVLVIACGLIGLSLWNLSRIDPGFQTANRLTFRVTLSGQKFTQQDARKQFYRELLQRLEALPGVESAAAVLIRPLSGSIGWDSAFTTESQSPEEQLRNPFANYEAISAGYFSTMGIPVLRGREFSAVDANGVVIINESTARRYFGTVDAVGRRLKFGPHTSAAPWLQVVGVVKDTHYREWEAARVDLYIPFEQRAQHRSDFVMKTTVDPETLRESVRREVLRLNPEQPISSVTTVEKLVDATLARPRFLALVLSLFGVVSLALVVMGLYAVLRVVFASREKEMAIRAAVGATPAALRTAVIGYGLWRASLGLAVGLFVAGAVARMLAPLLHRVSPFFGPVWFAAVVTMLAVALLASLAPARRASKLDLARVLTRE